MRRIERRRVERIRRRVITFGLGFTLGALTNEALTWRLRDSEPPESTSTARPIDAGPERTVAEPAGVQRENDNRQPVPAILAAPPQAEAAVEMLRKRNLEFPVEGVDRSKLRDTFLDSRGEGRAHEALDIMAPRGTPVLAVEDGTIAKLFNSRGGGGLTVYQFDPSQTLSYYYAHLDGYAPGLREGQSVRRDQTIGFVGSTGNASPDAPHLHFAIFRLTPERQWWKGEPINPYPVFK
jgi:murein DD-endopeptidase MepM/ murein hydrolase activator NlpD